MTILCGLFDDSKRKKIARNNELIILWMCNRVRTSIRCDWQETEENALSLGSIMNSVKNGGASAAGGLDFASVAGFLGAE